MGRHRADEGRFILVRDEPDYEYDLDVDRHNELLLLSRGRKVMQVLHEVCCGLDVHKKSVTKRLEGPGVQSDLGPLSPRRLGAIF